jgi:hypothetical protein
MGKTGSLDDIETACAVLEREAARLGEELRELRATLPQRPPTT